MTDDTRDEFETDGTADVPADDSAEQAAGETGDETVEDLAGESGADINASAEAIGEALSELSLDEQLEATRAERDDNLGKWQRSLADLENYRRRVQREMDESRAYQALPLARDLLPGLDNLQRAIQAAESNEAAADLVAGVKMVVEQVIGVLARHGVEPIPAIGEAFDPEVHEAIQQVPSDEHEPMTVLQEVEQGFRLGDRVVRPAKVIVSMAPTDSVAPADESVAESGDLDGETTEEN